MSMKRKTNFVLPTEKTMNYQRMSEREYAEMMRDRKKPDLSLFSTNRRVDTSGLSDRLKERLGVAI